MLTLPEELVLLAVDEATGSVASCGSRLPYALSAAVLAELLFSGHIALTGDLVTPNRLPPPSDPTAAAAFHLIAGAARPRAPRYWVEHLCSRVNVRDLSLQSLSARGLIHPEDHQFLMFRYYRYPLNGHQTLDALRTRLLQALHGDRSADDRARALTALAETCGLVRRTLGTAVWREVRHQAFRLSTEWPFSAAAIRAADDAEAAVLAATVATF
jgi:hypothetical protein